MQAIFRVLLYCAAFTCGLSTLACTRVATTAIRHPMQVGHVDDNQLAVPQPLTENSYALPAGALNNQARLTRLDQETLCVEVWLRQAHNGLSAAPNPWAHWAYQFETSDGQVLRDGRTQLLEPTTVQYQGRVPTDLVVGSRAECVDQDSSGACLTWEERAIIETQWLPGMVAVVAGGAHVCFPNNGRIGPATTALKFKLRRPAVGVQFEWLLVSR